MPTDQSAVLPGTVAVRFTPWLCDPKGGDWTNVPTSFSLTTALADASLGPAAGSSATWTVRDTCHAIFTAQGGTPTNGSTLQALADQIGLDRWSWRTVALDRSCNGVVAPPPDGIIDAITWTYHAGECSTRLMSVPIGAEPDGLAHMDAADDCDGCVTVFPEHATVAGGTVSLPRAKLCFQDGELTTRLIAPDTFKGCCGACTTTITVDFLDLAGQTNFPCGGPGYVSWTISGTSTANTTVSLSGSVGVVSSPTYNMLLTFDSSTLPAGNYSLHVFTQSAVCGQPYGPDGRFDNTFSFTVVCPKTTVTCQVQSQYDTTTVGSYFGVIGCGTYWYLDNIPNLLGMSTQATIGGTPTVCQTQVSPFESYTFVGGNIAVTLKLTDYQPFTITFTATAPNCITSTETRSYSAPCGSFTSDWPGQPYIFYGLVPLQVGSGCNAYVGQGFPGYAIAGATVTCTGQLSVTGTTATNGTIPSSGGQQVRWAATMASSYIYPKVGVDPSTLVNTWTVSYPPYFQSATYNDTDLATAFSQGDFYPGTACNLGGDLGPPASGYACGGCPLPMKTTLQATVAGASIALTYDPVAGLWGGYGQVPMHALTCVSPPNNPQPSFGPVTIYLYFGYLGSNSGNYGINPNPVRPYLSLFFAATGNINYDNGPSLCARTVAPYDSEDYGGWDSFGSDQSYGGIQYSATCPPAFYAEQKYEGSYYVNREDGSGIADSYDITIDIQITE